MWSIEVELDGCPTPSRLCECDSPASVAAVLLALCRAREMRPVTVRRISDPPGRAAPEGKEWPEMPLG